VKTNAGDNYLDEHRKLEIDGFFGANGNRLTKKTLSATR
jgi:hypothetical protein